MKIELICVGRLKDAHWKAAQEEYVKRLSRYAAIGVREVPECAASGDAASVRAAVRGEAVRLLKAAQACDHIFALSPDGEKSDSLGFARLLAELAASGARNVCFLVGGSNGLAEEVRRQSARILSFSDMTFAHALFRIMLLEQLYRACKINAGETYHK